MMRSPPVPETGIPGKFVHGSFNVFLYCTVYEFPFSVGKARLKEPLIILGVPMTGASGAWATAGATGPRQLAEAVTLLTRRMSTPIAVTVLVGVKRTTLLVV